MGENILMQKHFEKKKLSVQLNTLIEPSSKRSFWGEGHQCPGMHFGDSPSKVLGCILQIFDNFFIIVLKIRGHNDNQQLMNEPEQDMKN